MFNKGNNNLILHWAKTGKAQQTAVFPWITSDWASFASALGNELVCTWFDDFGNIFILRQAVGSALAYGNITAPPAPGTDAATTANTSVRTVGLNTGGLTAGAEVGNFVYDATIAKTGTPKTDALKLIKANSAGILTVSLLDTKYGNLQADPDAYATAPANADVLAIIRPYQSQIFATADATLLPPHGVAAQAILQNQYGFQQVGGLAMVTWDGVAAVVARQCLIASAATPGNVKPGGATWLTYAAGLAACANASTGTAGTLVPMWCAASLAIY